MLFVKKNAATTSRVIDFEKVGVTRLPVNDDRKYPSETPLYKMMGTTHCARSEQTHRRSRRAHRARKRQHALHCTHLHAQARREELQRLHERHLLHLLARHGALVRHWRRGLQQQQDRAADARADGEHDEEHAVRLVLVARVFEHEEAHDLREGGVSGREQQEVASGRRRSGRRTWPMNGQNWNTEKNMPLNALVTSPARSLLNRA